MKDSHTLYVRGSRWREIEKLAWELSNKKKRVIKPTDVADAILYKGVKSLDFEDIEEARKVP